MYDSIQSALTLGCRLQIAIPVGVLHQGVSNVEASTVGSYIGMQTVGPPHSLAYMVVCNQYKCQWHWLLHWDVHYKPAIPAGTHTGTQPMQRPLQPAPTLGCRLQLCHTCWCLHWHIAIVQSYAVGSYINRNYSR